MNCIFCDCQCVKIIYKESADVEEIWECDSHPYKVRYWSYYGPLTDLRYDFYVPYKENKYRFVFVKDIQKYFFIDSEKPIGGICKLPFIPKNITPENALHKLPMLLLFS